jgi:CPA2 family monovalent cation:H+ antiporter-2
MFFISVGMLLDPRALLREPLPIFGLFAAILFGKAIIIFFVGLVMRIPLRVTLITGMILSQMGEFLFVLARAAEGTGLLDGTLTSQLMAAAILSMLVTPLLMYMSPKFAAGVTKFGMLQRYMGLDNVDEQQHAQRLRDHVIIAGYGIAGQELASALRLQDIPYAIVELNAETVRKLRQKKEPVFFGDVISEEMLHRLGIHHARELVIAISDPNAALRALGAARRLVPDLPILIRARYVGEVPELLDVGATNVVPSEYESAVEIVSQVLSRNGIPRDHIDAYVENMHLRCRVKKLS